MNVSPHQHSPLTTLPLNYPFYQAAKVCIAEVEELVEPGQLDPDEIHLPGIYVQRIFKGEQSIDVYVFRVDQC